MAETAAHLVEQMIPWVPTRQWVVSVPIPSRYWMATSTHLMAQVQTIIRRTIHQHYVNQAVKLGHLREQVQAGSVTFIQERQVKPQQATNAIRLAMGCLSRWFDWRSAFIVTPETFTRWHRQGFRLFWRWKSKPGRPALPKDLYKPSFDGWP